MGESLLPQLPLDCINKDRNGPPSHSTQCLFGKAPLSEATPFGRRLRGLALWIGKITSVLTPLWPLWPTHSTSRSEIWDFPMNFLVRKPCRVWKAHEQAELRSANGF
eukprot:1137662-Pelagomonas_calceolata.AAC.15